MSERTIGPLYIGRDNSVAVIGRDWRVVQDLARELGVKPRRIGRIALFSAAELIVAIERATAPVVDSAPAEPNEADELEKMRARIRRAG